MWNSQGEIVKFEKGLFNHSKRYINHLKNNNSCFKKSFFVIECKFKSIVQYGNYFTGVALYISSYNVKESDSVDILSIGGYCMFECIYVTGSVNGDLVERLVASIEHGVSPGKHILHFIHQFSFQS